MTDKLKFSRGNRKLKALAVELGIPKSHVVGFDLPAGWTCPFADKCLSRADEATGKITDSENCQYRCYAVSVESYSPNARRARWHNLDLIKTLNSDEIAELINESLPERVEVVRIHSSGDFFSREYFNAWIKVASDNPEIQFFGYTKGIQYVSENKPENFNLVYSYGGKLDSRVTSDIPVCYVVDKEYKGDLPLPCEVTESGDYFAILQGKSFGLKLHGTQPAK